MRIRLLICLLTFSLYGIAQSGIKKTHYAIINNDFEFTLNYEKALSHTQVDGLRYLNTRRRIPIEGTKISIELFSAQELLDTYGKPISPLTINNPINAQEVKFKLSPDNYTLLVTSDTPIKREETQNANNLFPKKIITTFGNTIEDDGGINGNYSNNKNYTQTIYSANGENPYLIFTNFSVENNFDILYIYDGADVSAKLIGEYTGGNNPQIIKASGAYLTLVFTSDGSITQSGWSAWLGRGTAPPPSVMTAADCASADPFCSGTNYNFPATTGTTTGEAGPDYGCVLSQPNPAWYFMQIANSGPLVLNIAGSAGGDVDFVCWGPYTSTNVCSILTGTCTGDHCGGNAGAASGNIVDCSFSINATETCTIPNAVAGQYYMMMITNYSNQTQNITLNQTNTSSTGAGSTNCNIVNCGVTASNTGPYCVGQTISLSAATTNTTATTYVWTGPGGFTSSQQNPTISNATTAMAGTYSVTGTTGGTVTCVATTSVVVSANTPPVVNSPTICVGGTATLTATPATNTFVWSTGATTATTTVNPTSTTIYTVTGTVGTCTASNTATVTVVPNPTVTVNSGSVCGGASATLTATGATAYSWGPTTGLSPTSGATVIATPATTTVYTVSGTAGTCSATPVTATVTIFPAAAITATSNTMCAGGIGTTITAGGGVSYTWTPATNLSSSSNPSIIASPTATTNYTVTGQDANGCLGTAVSTVTVYPLPTFTITAPPICIGAPLIINVTPAIYANYSIPAISYSTTNAPISITPTTTLNTMVNMIVTDIHGCSNTGTVGIVVHSLPTITSSATPVCVSSTGTLTAYGAITYTWSPTTYLNPSQGSEVYITPSTTANINYVVTGTDINGCSNTSNLTVQANALPVVNIVSTTTAGCTPQCANYTVTSSPAPSSANPYSWTSSNGETTTGTSPTICFTAAGNNSVKLTYTDINGCINTATASVITYPIPMADFDYTPKPVTILTPDVHFTNETASNIGGVTSYLWNFGDSLTLADTSLLNNPVYTYNNSGKNLVTLIATSANGCKDTASRIIIVEEDFAIYVPNAFTPTGDGKNETFKAEADGILSFTMYIFDRWGNTIFTAYDINTGWDGRRNNKGNELLQQDVYVWKIEVNTVNHQGRSYTGTVTLLK